MLLLMYSCQYLLHDFVHCRAATDAAGSRSGFRPMVCDRFTQPPSKLHAAVLGISGSWQIDSFVPFLRLTSMPSSIYKKLHLIGYNLFFFYIFIMDLSARSMHLMLQATCASGHNLRDSGRRIVEREAAFNSELLRFLSATCGSYSFAKSRYSTMGIL
jgi:hypothetical protein